MTRDHDPVRDSVTGEAPTVPDAPRTRRRISLARIAAAMLAVVVAVGGVFVFRSTGGTSADSVPTSTAWAAPYVDVTIPPLFAFESPGDHVDDVVLAFVVAHQTDPCRPAWGAVFDLDDAASELDMDRRVARLRQTGKDAVVSFGGAANDELAVVCEDDDELADAYLAVIDRYDVTTIDLDIEGDALLDDAANERRGRAIASVQSQRRDADGDLAVWVTLPVSAEGLTGDGISALDALLDAGVDVAGVNGMVMNFGGSREGRSMSESVEAAVDSMANQVTAAWKRRGDHISEREAFARVGATPMIGRNDVVTDVFTLDDAEKLHELAVDRGLGRLSYWSLNRDRPCGTNEEPIAAASNFCSHEEQDEFAFARVLDDLPGRAAVAAGADMTWERIELLEDDPDHSPYDIWNPERAFVGGTKVVWHGYVYESKWWNQGSNPEQPVENPWDTPWQIVGPVLPEDLIDPVEVPRGAEPSWNGEDVYDTGDRVWIDGSVYEAKWWNTGEPPNRPVSNDWDTAWVEIDALEYTNDE